MKRAATLCVVTANADVQTEALYFDPDDRQLTRLSVIEVGPRGGQTVAGAMLTDDKRAELIENLGGIVPGEAPAPHAQAIDLDVFVKAALDSRVGYVPTGNIISHTYTMACYLQTAGVQFMRDGAPWSLEGMSMHGWDRMIVARGLLSEEG